MTFEDWLRRPVYVAQCKTWSKANELGVCCSRFRALPAYRDDLARKARSQVAKAILAERQQCRMH